jgi:hypothetical protein
MTQEPLVTRDQPIDTEPAALPEGATDVPRDQWSEWFARASQEVRGRSVSLRYADVALGEVQLAQGEPLVAIDFEELGGTVALTIRYGDGVVARRHVVAEPQRVLEEQDDAGKLVLLVIVDSTRRMTSVGLA